eukprot:scaffold926_cov248-Pinguiococcus_pyrenoidosus.AAC.21
MSSAHHTLFPGSSSKKHRPPPALRGVEEWKANVEDADDTKGTGHRKERCTSERPPRRAAGELSEYSATKKQVAGFKRKRTAHSAANALPSPPAFVVTSRDRQYRAKAARHAAATFKHRPAKTSAASDGHSCPRSARARRRNSGKPGKNASWSSRR